MRTSTFFKIIPFDIIFVREQQILYILEVFEKCVRYIFSARYDYNLVKIRSKITQLFSHKKITRITNKRNISEMYIIFNSSIEFKRLHSHKTFDSKIILYKLYVLNLNTITKNYFTDGYEKQNRRKDLIN